MIEKLPKFFIGTGEVSGFEFRQVYECKSGYVYYVKSDSREYFESFNKKAVPICIDFTNRIYSKKDTKEIYPKAKHFGIWAWTFNMLNEAIDKICN